MRLVTGMLVVLALGLQACDKAADYDRTPPGAPTGLRTQTGDNFIELLWNQNPERDVAGYNVFVSSSYNGRYELIGSTNRPYYLDNGARNGFTYYYAVTAYDFEGNESALSRDVAYDVPRPEGYNVVMHTLNYAPATAGYDFSSYSIIRYNDQYADMYLEYYGGNLYMNVRSDTDIQDLGPTNSILDIRQAPTSGWSPTHDVRLQVGHTYAVWTWDDHYAKFRVSSMSQNRIVFDWAYQLQQSNPMLKPGGGGAREVPHTERRR